MPGFELWGNEEKKELMDVIDSGILMRYGFDGLRNGHWKAKELEKEICQKFEVGYAQLVSSGTAALCTALAGLGVGAGDEVIMPSFTFVASFEAVLAVGAVPVLVDIDDTLTLDPVKVEEAVTPRTRVVMPVHMCGSMADLDALADICTRHHLILLEDACQSTGATYHGKALGTVGDAGCLSFDFVKTVTCGEGGVIMTNNRDLWKKCDGYSDHGHDHLGKDRGADLHPFLGLNYRISELHAAVGLAQFRKLDQFLAIQKHNYSIIENAIRGIEGVTFRRVPDPSGNSCTFLSFMLPTEEIARRCAQSLATAGVDGCFYWFDNNWHYIRKWDHLKNIESLSGLSQEQVSGLGYLREVSFDQSDNIMSRTISVSIKLGWTEEQVQARAANIAMVINESLVLIEN